MLLEERQAKILEQLRMKGRVYASDLSELLSVSEDTVRRDLNQLSQAGKLRRVHGGALPVGSQLDDYKNRRGVMDPLKSDIAAAAVARLHTGQTILLDSGNTCLHMARLIPKDMQLTLVTPSPITAIQLLEHPNVEVIVLGGRMHKPAVMTCGASTNNMISKMHFDVSFLGVTALHPTVGLTASYLEEAETQTLIINQSTETVLLADHGKLDKVAPYQIAPCKAIDALVTDAESDPLLLNQFAELEIEIITP